MPKYEISEENNKLHKKSPGDLLLSGVFAQLLACLPPELSWPALFAISKSPSPKPHALQLPDLSPLFFVHLLH